MLAKGLAKLEPRDLLLVDKEKLEPGNLVRHEALPSQVALGKATAMAALLQPLASDRQVRALQKDIVQEWDEVVSELVACDLVIDATAGSGVHSRLLTNAQLADARIAWCYAKPGPEFGILALRRPHSTLTTEEAELALREGMDDALWTRFVGSEKEDGALVWPEPGCYFPTFNAPYHRLRMLADAFVTTLESWLNAGCPTDVITLLQQEEPAGGYGMEQHIATQVSLPRFDIADRAQERERQGRGAD